MPELEKETMQNYLQLARDAVEQKDYDTATDHLIFVLQFDSNNSEAIGIMGDMALSQKDLNTAEGYYLRRLELDPESYEAHMDMGRLFTKRCEYDNAIEEFKTALQCDKDKGDPICL